MLAQGGVGESNYVVSIGPFGRVVCSSICPRGSLQSIRRPMGGSHRRREPALRCHFEYCVHGQRRPSQSAGIERNGASEWIGVGHLRQQWTDRDLDRAFFEEQGGRTFSAKRRLRRALERRSTLARRRCPPGAGSRGLNGAETFLPGVRISKR
ncbi:MAG: 4Fe-4S binding protein [Hyphomicrobiales bacterium]|nr:4Fe-4S binding protein [Hyphomicrobiales bacterium]